MTKPYTQKWWLHTLKVIPIVYMFKKRQVVYLPGLIQSFVTPGIGLPRINNLL